ncbi:CAAX amino terminal protease self- immunity [compost metagenome]
MTTVLSLVPTFILIALINFNKKWLLRDLINMSDKKMFEYIFYSFCISFIGYSLLTTLSGMVFNLPPPEKHIITPIMYIYSVLFSPIFEELICRKLIPRLFSKYNNITKYLISSFVFSALHFNLTSFLGYMFLGIIWSHYYKKSNNIFVPIMSHFLFNYLVILIQSVKG